MKKLSLLLAVILLICSLPGCSETSQAPYAPSGLGIMEEKRYSNVTLDDDFSEDKILVSIQNDYGLALHTYTPEDFPEIACIEVEDLTDAYFEDIQAILDGNPNPPAMGMDQIDIYKFHQILCITLKNPGKKNVLKAIKKLEKRVDIIHVGPDSKLKLY